MLSEKELKYYLSLNFDDQRNERFVVDIFKYLNEGEGKHLNNVTVIGLRQLLNLSSNEDRNIWEAMITLSKERYGSFLTVAYHFIPDTEVLAIVDESEIADSLRAGLYVDPDGNEHLNFLPKMFPNFKVNRGFSN
ncbi:hypothetical protein L1264_03445 [Pseudoalteromonas sp. APAL1]|uniref:hypothetical protein n=1 Tax=Pseudoalteromonas sp. APAL1 TaxID=2908883 RepID=UPI001F204ADF|nr:hypothetical protein [Pseudoalteromonas sp. APAL1]MCF2919531.1 hypothetical protein [Pseudoalteromonas sp. APAL1]